MTSLFSFPHCGFDPQPPFQTNCVILQALNDDKSRRAMQNKAFAGPKLEFRQNNIGGSDTDACCVYRMSWPPEPQHIGSIG